MPKKMEYYNDIYDKLYPKKTIDQKRQKKILIID